MTRRLRPRMAKRSLGQNFLVDPALQRRIVAAVGAGPGDSILEIGPGRGALTDHLVATGAHITAIELDDALAAALTVRYADTPRVAIAQGDILATELPALIPAWSRTRVVGNIPYNITTPILFHLLRPPLPADIVLTLQAEVADRILAEPGNRSYGALSVGVRVHACATRLFGIPRTAFRPVPRVESVTLRITPHAPPPLTAAEATRIRTLTRAAFGWRRKQLGTIVRRHPDLRSVARPVLAALAARGLSHSLRPEQLSVQDFVALARAAASDGD